MSRPLKCPHCGHIHETEEMFCLQCNKHILPVAKDNDKKNLDAMKRFIDSLNNPSEPSNIESSDQTTEIK